jgi:RNA polymerase sigma factor (sigma-70 family)
VLGIDTGVATAEAQCAPTTGEDDDDEPASRPVVVALVPDTPPNTDVASRFEDVYRSSYQRMIRVAFLMTGSNEAAEEIVQDAFVALFQRFETITEPAGYLYRSVVNGCRNRHRRQVLAERLHVLRPVATVLPPELDETLHALETLTPRRRTAIVLRFYADLPLADIAGILGCTTGTVKSLIHRGLAQLKQVIEP